MASSRLTATGMAAPRADARYLADVQNDHAECTASIILLRLHKTRSPREGHVAKNKRPDQFTKTGLGWTVRGKLSSALIC
jgi:hypothetical protein